MGDEKRTASGELTLPIPRHELAPVSAVSGDSSAPASSVPGPTIEQLADIERARRDAEDERETLVECPGPCRDCPCCRGTGMVSPTRAAEWKRLVADLVTTDDPEVQR
jgi:hypothetical protein